MRKADAITHFGSSIGVAKVLGLSKSAVYQWDDIVPYASALRLAEISGHRLTIDRSLYDTHLRPIKEDLVGAA